MDQVADGVYRLGSRWVNFYLVEDGGALTLVDTGLPGYSGQVGDALARLGKKPSDIKAIVLTHSHSDHIGGAPAAVRASGAPVLVPAGEAERATGEAPPGTPQGAYSSLWRLTMMAFSAHLIANKGVSTATVDAVTPYDVDEVLDVPGKPRAVYTPGHSPAHCGLLLGDKRTLFSGDALATIAVNTGERGVMVHPFNEDRGRAVESLDVLADVDADVLLPGHGDPWSGPIAEAVATARARL